MFGATRIKLDKELLDRVKRYADIAGYSSVEEFQEGVAGATTKDVLQLILMTQYFDMLKEVGGRAGASTILPPHSPGGLDSVIDQLRNAVMVGQKAADA